MDPFDVFSTRGQAFTPFLNKNTQHQIMTGPVSTDLSLGCLATTGALDGPKCVAVAAAITEEFVTWGLNIQFLKKGLLIVSFPVNFSQIPAQGGIVTQQASNGLVFVDLFGLNPYQSQNYPIIRFDFKPSAQPAVTRDIVSQPFNFDFDTVNFNVNVDTDNGGTIDIWAGVAVISI